MAYQRFKDNRTTRDKNLDRVHLNTVLEHVRSTVFYLRFIGKSGEYYIKI